jgi:hypothetical protein
MIEISLLVLEKKIVKKFQYVFTILIVSSSGEELSPSFDQT